MVANRSRKMDKEYYIYKKNCWTGAVTYYISVSKEDEAEKLVKELKAVAPFPYTYFYL